jgi:hypothetical protein
MLLLRTPTWPSGTVLMKHVGATNRITAPMQMN